MRTERRDFDREAAAWDENPARVKLANEVADAILQQIVLTADMDVLDFGCGTGLLTLRLQPLARSVTGADSSQRMLDVLKAKAAKQHIANMRTQYLDFEKGDVPAGDYDLIASSMTLHHVQEIRPLFDQFHKLTRLGGYLCIADLDSENGRFHDDNTGVFHFGFDREALRKVFVEAGFGNVRDMTAAEVVKPTLTGEIRRFPVFLMTGRKDIS